MNEPVTEWGKKLLAASWWNEGMRGHFTRLPSGANSPDFMAYAITAIEEEAAKAALAAHDCFWDGQPPRPSREPQDIESLRIDVTDEQDEPEVPSGGPD